MSPRATRILASFCLILTPVAYILGVKLLHGEHPILSKIIIMGWMFVSLSIGAAAALTFRNQIFGLNCGSLLAYSVPIITTAFTLQVLEYHAGAYIMYGLFAISFAYGSITLIKYLKQ